MDPLFATRLGKGPLVLHISPSTQLFSRSGLLIFVYVFVLDSCRRLPCQRNSTCRAFLEPCLAGAIEVSREMPYLSQFEREGVEEFFGSHILEQILRERH